MAAIINARGESIDTIIVARYNTKVSISKPCPSCMLAIKDTGIKNIYYTITENEIGYIKV